MFSQNEDSDSESDISSETPRARIEIEGRLCPQAPTSCIVQKENRKTRYYKRLTGKCYTTQKGKPVSERMFKELEPCRKKYDSKVSLDDQKRIFEQYWSVGDHNMRISYMAGLMEINDKKITKAKNNEKKRNRLYTPTYFLIINNTKIGVCQNCFKRTFGETDRFLRTVANKKIC